MNNIISLNDLLVIYNLPSHLVVVLTLEGKFEYVNTSVGALLGYWEENLLGNSFSSIIHPDDSPNDVLDFYKPDGLSYTHTAIKRVRTSEGTYRFFSWSFTKPGDSQYIYSIAQDCTDKMELEEIFRFSSLKHNSPRGISIIDQNKKLLWSNDSFEKLTGYSRKDLVSKNLFNALSGPLTKAENKSYIVSKIDAGLAFSNECFYHHKNGSPLWMKIDAQPLFDNSTGIAKWFLVLSDITEEKNKLQKITSVNLPAPPSVPESDLSCIVVERGTGKIIEGNTQALAIYQYSKEEFETLYFKDLFAGFAPFTSNLDPLATNKETTTHESYHKNKNGELFRVQSTYAFSSDNGNLVVTSICKDLPTMHKRPTLPNRQDFLKHIAWKQSHLMRSPLTNLKSLLVFLRDDSGNAQFLNYMQTELERLDKVIKEIVYDTSVVAALEEQS